MTEWIRIIILATHGTHIWTIITLIRSTTQKAKKDLRHPLKLNSNNSYRHRTSGSVLVCFVNAQVLFPEILGTCYGTDMRKVYIFFPAPNSLSEITTEHYRWKKIKFWHLRILGIGSSSHCPIISSDGIRNVSGTIPENLPKFDSGNNMEYLQVMLSMLMIIIDRKFSDKTSERRERAGSRKSRKLSKSTIIAVWLRVIDFQNI